MRLRAVHAPSGGFMRLGAVPVVPLACRGLRLGGPLSFSGGFIARASPGAATLSATRLSAR
eukprot:6682307-Lingulodinium_polyedra.AAC.1